MRKAALKTYLYEIIKHGHIFESVLFCIFFTMDIVSDNNDIFISVFNTIFDRKSLFIC